MEVGPDCEMRQSGKGELQEAVAVHQVAAALVLQDQVVVPRTSVEQMSEADQELISVQVRQLVQTLWTPVASHLVGVRSFQAEDPPVVRLLAQDQLEAEHSLLEGVQADSSVMTDQV